MIDDLVRHYTGSGTSVIPRCRGSDRRMIAARSAHNERHLDHFLAARVGRAERYAAHTLAQQQMWAAHRSGREEHRQA